MPKTKGTMCLKMKVSLLDPLTTFTFTFSHLADAFVQSDVQVKLTIHARVFIHEYRWAVYCGHLGEPLTTHLLLTVLLYRSYLSFIYGTFNTSPVIRQDSHGWQT